MNMFRLPDGKLDRQYLRVCATFKLLRQKKIDGKRAAALLLDVGIGPNVVEHWKTALKKDEEYALVDGFGARR